MTIGTDSLIDFFGTQDQVDDGSTATVATTAFSEASNSWTNDDDALFANFVLECQFDTTFPSAGTIDLYCRPLNLQSTSDPGVPAATNLTYYLGTFPIDFAIAADTNYFSYIFGARLPNNITSQIYEFYFHNNATGQTIGIDWNLWAQPNTVGPHG